MLTNQLTTQSSHIMTIHVLNSHVADNDKGGIENKMTPT